MTWAAFFGEKKKWGFGLAVWRWDGVGSQLKQGAVGKVCRGIEGIADEIAVRAIEGVETGMIGAAVKREGTRLG